MTGLVQEISELLSQHGGWGLAAIAFYVCKVLYDRRESDREAYNAAMELRHTEFTALLRETQDALSSVGAIIQKCAGAKDD